MKTRSSFGRLLVLAAVAAAVAAGCAAVNPTVATLEKAKALSGQERYAEAADLPFECTRADEGCSQLYLITGNACYRLAKAAEAEGRKEAARARYRCAADRLAAGIDQTETWPSAQARAQTFENLCESLRSLQDLEKGDAARQLTQRLLAAAERFLRLEPGHPAGVYFATSARFAQVSGEMLDPADPAALCRRVNELLADLEQALPAARGSRYEENYRRLLADLNGAKRALAGCR